MAVGKLILPESTEDLQGTMLFIFTWSLLARPWLENWEVENFKNLDPQSIEEFYLNLANWLHPGQHETRRANSWRVWCWRVCWLCKPGTSIKARLMGKWARGSELSQVIPRERWLGFRYGQPELPGAPPGGVPGPGQRPHSLEWVSTEERKFSL